jgi:hypothetical protein
MNEPLVSLSRILTDAILPNLKSVQANHAEQIAANDRLENAIKELRQRLESEFSFLSAQLTACRAELAATQAIFHATQVQRGVLTPDIMTLIH